MCRRKSTPRSSSILPLPLSELHALYWVPTEPPANQVLCLRLEGEVLQAALEPGGRQRVGDGVDQEHDLVGGADQLGDESFLWSSAASSGGVWSMMLWSTLPEIVFSISAGRNGSRRRSSPGPGVVHADQGGVGAYDMKRLL